MGFPLNNPLEMRAHSNPTFPPSGNLLYMGTDNETHVGRTSDGRTVFLETFDRLVYTSAVGPIPPGHAFRNLMVLSGQTGIAAFAAPTTPSLEGASLIIRIKDDGTVKTITWNAIYRAMDTTNVPLPTTTVAGKWLYLGFIYNATDTKWDLIASLTQS